MEAAGLELNPSPGRNRQVKTRGWLQYTNNTAIDPLGTLGKVIAEFMEVASDDSSQERVTAMLQKHDLSYLQGGYITSLGATAVSKTSQEPGLAELRKNGGSSFERRLRNSRDNSGFRGFVRIVRFSD